MYTQIPFIYMHWYMFLIILLNAWKYEKEKKSFLLIEKVKMEKPNNKNQLFNYFWSVCKAGIRFQNDFAFDFWFTINQLMFFFQLW